MSKDRKKAESSGIELDGRPEIDLKQARREVYRLGIKGLEHGDKQRAVIDLLAELGAEVSEIFYYIISLVP